MKQTLSDARIRRIKPKAKPFKVSDGGGLYLAVNPGGSLLWRLKYRMAGKEKLLALGSYPAISLQEARQARDEAKTAIKRGIDPVRERQQEKAKAKQAAENTFEVIAREYIGAAEAKGRAPRTLVAMERHFHLAMPLHCRPIADIRAPEVLEALNSVHARAPRTALALRDFLGAVFRHAVVTCRCESDPTRDLRGALAAPEVVHYAAIIDPERFGQLLRAIDAYRGTPQTMFAMKIAPHIMLRSGELRGGRWNEINFEKATWTVPAYRMKKRREHSIPLSRQVLELLRELHTVTGTGDYLFPSPVRVDRALSDSSLNAVLAAIGFSGEHTIHGNRTTFSSMAHPSGLWSEEAVERQLAHVVGSAVRRAYQRDVVWDERARLAQWWSDRIDEMRACCPHKEERAE